MPQDTGMDTHQKALRINLDRTIFGSFAEIGAGQEVARWFLRVGGASGTVAKTISAYDKEVSDALYGAGTRYVSRPRLEAMLDTEWTQLHDQVGESHGTTARLFAFADTVAARNYEGTNDAHGWMGVRFQERTGGDASQVLLHVNMRDQSALLQQEALGTLGVNLLHALYFERGSMEQFLEALLAGLQEGRLEIDMVDARGGAFKGWDRRQVLVTLVTHGMAEAVVFTVDGKLLPLSELVYKAPVVLAPGTFEHVSPVHARILASGIKELEAELRERPPEEPETKKVATMGAYCLSAAAPLENVQGPDATELRVRADRLIALGAPVVIARRREYYHVASLFNRYTSNPVRFGVGVSALFHVFAESFYRNLEGQILEGIARLFARNVRFYVCPMEAAAMKPQLESLVRTGWEISTLGGRVCADQMRPPPPVGHLYEYLLSSRFVVPVKGAEGE